MTAGSARQPRPFERAGVYAEPGLSWALRGVGPHLHPGSETATVHLADRAASYGFPGGSTILEVASALGGPARFLARRFGATVISVDMDPAMHAAAVAASRLEGLGLRCQPVLALAEKLPLAGDSIGAAWSQDAICHMDKAPVVAEVARVLQPGSVFAFSDWTARRGFTTADRNVLMERWGFPSLLSIEEYVGLLDATGFDVLLAEDRTLVQVAGRPQPAFDQELYDHAFGEQYGEDELKAQKQRNEAWGSLIAAGRAGYALFVARRRGQ